MADAYKDPSRQLNRNLRMGVALWTEHTEPFLLADRARSASKIARGNYQQPVRIFDEEMQRRELLNQRLLNDLSRALEEKQFVVLYQPKYDIQSEPPKLASAEALIRWRHPELGMISPGDFIPLFEGNGLISMVDSFVWNETAIQVRAWWEKYGFKETLIFSYQHQSLQLSMLIFRFFLLSP